MSEKIVAAYADYRMTEPITANNICLVSFDQVTFKFDDGEYRDLDFDSIDIDVDPDDPCIAHVTYTDPDSDACDDPEKIAESLDRLKALTDIRLLVEPENETFTIAEVLGYRLVAEFDGPADAFDRDNARFVTKVDFDKYDASTSYVYRDFPKDMLADIEIDDSE